jgi:hypothetical protein
VMKCAVPLLFGFSWILIVGQTAPTQQEKKEQAIEKICKGPEINSGPELDELHHVVQRLGKLTEGDMQHKQYVALVDGSVINAWDVNLNMNASLISLLDKSPSFSLYTGSAFSWLHPEFRLEI